MDVLAIVLSLVCLLVTGPALVFGYLTFLTFRANQTLLLTQQNDILAKMKAPDTERIAALEAKVSAMALTRGLNGR